MRQILRIINFLFFCLCALTGSSQSQAFPILLDVLDENNISFSESWANQNVSKLIAMPISVEDDNWYLVGARAEFQDLDIASLWGFNLVVWSDDEGQPQDSIYSEIVHRNNYFCNQGGSGSTVQMDLLLRNPITLSTGDYWLSIHLAGESFDGSSMLMKTVNGTGMNNTNGIWSPTDISPALRLLGTTNAGIIDQFPYLQSFGAGEMAGWNMTDLFPHGIQSFEIDSTTYSEADENQSSLRISGYGGENNAFDRFIFYNVTSPKFRFEAGHNYEISIDAHHPVFGEDYGSMGAFAMVYVPDPPELGFLESLNWSLSGLQVFNNDHNLVPIQSNTYFQEKGIIYSPMEDIETRIGIHMEFGAMPIGVETHFWLDHFRIVDLTSTALDEHEQHKIKTYPNPSTGTVYVQSSVMISEMVIRDISGRIIERHSYENKIDLSAYPKGIYYLEFGLENGDIFNQKVVRE